MKQTSGFDALIEALKQSGVNVDGRFDADSEAPHEARDVRATGEVPSRRT
nr:hypothetical protein [Eggerthella sinensis]